MFINLSAGRGGASRALSSALASLDAARGGAEPLAEGNAARDLLRSGVIRHFLPSKEREHIRVLHGHPGATVAG